LRKIRNNLRSLLLGFYNSINENLQNQINDLLRNAEGDPSNLDSQKIKDLTKRQENLRIILKQSICACGICHDSKNDMVWHAGWGEWWCLKCFKDEEELIDPNNKFNRGVIIYENGEKPCHLLGWCPYGALVECFMVRNLDSKFTCMVYDHDCPVFYVSQQISERSLDLETKNINLKDSLKNCNGYNENVIKLSNIEKPCHILDWCPYGALGDDFHVRKLDYKYGCKILPHDCPVFYHAEFVKEFRKK
jgi:hypothetical protein